MNFNDLIILFYQIKVIEILMIIYNFISIINYSYLFYNNLINQKLIIFNLILTSLKHLFINFDSGLNH
jgi:hypothetical protein